VIVHLHEAPVLDRVAFEGNKKIKDKELDAVIESKPRGTLQRAAVQADVGRIIDAYRRAGRDDARVVPKIIPRGEDRVDLVYEVTEGAKTTVRQINFAGNRVFGKRQLAAVIKTSATNMLSFLTGGDEYDPDRVAADREALRLYYRSKGYADASITSAHAEYDPALHGFALTFSIDEGPLYHFGDIDVVGNVPGLDAGKLRRLPVARSGAVFNGGALDKTDEILAIELAKLGTYSITGLDLSRTFVKTASEKAAGAGVRVQFVQGSASNMPFTKESFEFLLCRAAFKNFADPVGALQEMCRVLRPGGSALLIDLSRDARREEVSRAVDEMGLSTVNRVLTKLAFKTVLIRSAYSRAEFEQMLAQTEFSRFDISQDGIGFEITMTK